MVNATIPLFALLVIMLGMMGWYASFYGDDVVDDKFANIQEPTGFLTTLEFLSDLLVAVAQTFAAIITFTGSDLPASVLFYVRAIFGTVFALALIAALATLL